MAIDKKWYIFGGIGAVVLVGGYYLLSSGGSSSASSGTNTGDLSTLYPSPTVIGSGGTTASNSGTDQLSQLLSAQLQQSTQNYDLNKLNTESNERISLATLDTQKTIALDTNKTNIGQALANQLGNIVAGMKGSYSWNKGSTTTGLSEVAGAIGFDNGKITLDIGSQQFNVGNGALYDNGVINRVQHSPLLTNQSVSQAISSVGANK